MVMKHKILVLLVAVLSVAMFSGCGGDDVKSKSKDTFMFDKDTKYGYHIYKNYKYGYYFSYPTFLTTPEEWSNSETRPFESNDGRIKLTASARFNNSGRNEKSLFDEEKYFLERDGHRITYSLSRKGMVVFSGFTPDNKVFYKKIAICDLYSPQYGDVRSVIACIDAIWENNDRYRGEAIAELLKKFPFERK